MLAKQFDKVFIDSISNALNVQVIEWNPSVAIKIYRRCLDFILFQLPLITDVFCVQLQDAKKSKNECITNPGPET